jgi:hypothetical protein
VTINRTLDPADRSGDAGLEPLGDIAASDGDHVSALKYYRLAAETLVADGFSYGVAGRVRALLAELDENDDDPPGTSPDGPSVTAG